MEASLAAMDPGYTLLAGDSHSAYLASVAPTAFRLVNAAIAGIGSEDYARRLEPLTLRPRAGFVVLSLGANDLALAARCSAPVRVAVFEQRIRTIIGRLVGASEAVIVLAIPPIGDSHEAFLDRGAVPLYSRALARASSGFERVLSIDPYRALRSERYGVARPGALYDDLHVADRPAVWRAVVDAAAALASRCALTASESAVPRT